MDQSLRDVAQQGNIDALYALIRMDVKVLDRIDELPFVESPLHVAAFAGHTRFASEIMRLKQSFSKKPNEDGFTPVHLALQNNQTEVVRQLLDVDEDLVRVQGKEGVTPLHYVAQTGNLVLLAEFLNVCPKSIKNVTIRRDTAFHIALKNNQVDAFNILMNWYERTRFNDKLASHNKQDKDALLSGVGDLLNSKDEEGNTLLHVAVSQNQLQVVERLLNSDGVTINSENLEGCTIWQGQRPISREMEHMLHEAREVLRLSPSRRAITHEVYLRYNFDRDFQTFMLRLQMRLPNELRSILLVVAVLYLTINFQLVLTPPGGLWQDNCDPQHNPVGNCTVPHQAGKLLYNNGPINRTPPME
ncbi:ankyrin repeat-containing protein BDA1-like [Corylus avellana]|uniref:ankyrin repeat-containing protein BDA1-like n=1 Tax=Corylus avellana TaxID=13451 RepID=UPI00286A302E|nr:ankyrin repeat-containing protein BDA1-like [Corylus avellana]